MKLNLIPWLAVLTCIVALPASAAAPSAITQAGPVVGKYRGHVRVFRGIPYAAAPVGALRWKAPQPPKNWTEPRSATRDGAICLQAKEIGSALSVGREDCLSLNLWAPESPGPGLPVMVFLHGGFFAVGSGDEKLLQFFHLQDGYRLAAAGPVIVVTLNYRLGPLGFFPHPALDDGSPDTRSGNFGLLDQIAALQWVQANIAAFGGDPAQVTIFGESAGASSVLSLMASPLTKGLFSRAIVESGYLKNIPKAAAQAMTAEVAAKAGCAEPTIDMTSACLRGLSGEKVLEASATSASAGKEQLFVPYQDGWVIPEPLADAYRLGHIRPISVVLGTNTDEGGSLVKPLFGSKVRTDEELGQAVTKAYGPEIWARARKIYGAATPTGIASPQKRLIQVVTDGIFTCPISTLGRQLAAVPGMKVRRYVFSHHLHLPILAGQGAVHGLELFYVFGTLPAFPGLRWYPGEGKFIREVQTAWADFAAGKDPGNAWPLFSAGENVSWELGHGLIRDFRAERCEALGL